MFLISKKKKCKFKHTREQKKIYRKTKKPIEYVRVDNPKTYQEKRQVMFNKWCKAKGVYCGSYLPVDPNELTHKGWIQTRHLDENNTKRAKLKNKVIKNYIRKSTGQEVQFNSENDLDKINHYHWLVRNGNRHIGYKDKYGKIFIGEKEPKEFEHHIIALDKDFTYDIKEITELKKFYEDYLNDRNKKKRFRKIHF